MTTASGKVALVTGAGSGIGRAGLPLPSLQEGYFGRARGRRRECVERTVAEAGPAPRGPSPLPPT